MDVILRNAAVDKAKAGDKCTFNGTLVVVPDVRQLYKAGTVPSSHQRSEGGPGASGGGEGFTGLKALGVRDLTYKTAFLASYVPILPSRVHSAACLTLCRSTDTVLAQCLCATRLVASRSTLLAEIPCLSLTATHTLC